MPSSRNPICKICPLRPVCPEEVSPPGGLTGLAVAITVISLVSRFRRDARADHPHTTHMEVDATPTKH